jgi:hypothetical protein
MLSRPIPKSAKLGLAGLTAIFIAAVVLLPMAKADSGKSPEFVLKGTVTDAETGLPIAGAKVGDTEKYDSGKYGTVTDSNGIYEYKTWYEEHGMVVEIKGYTPLKKTLLTKLFGSEKEKIIDFKLTPQTNEQGVKIATLINQLGDKDAMKRSIAMNNLKRIGKPAIGALVETLKDENLEARKGAVGALGLMGADAKDAIGAMVDVLNGDDKPLYVYAGYSLVKIEEPPFPMVTELLKDGKLPVRRAIVENLGGFGQKAVALLILALKDEDPLVRNYACWGLGKIGPEAKDAIGALTLATKDDDKNFQHQAIEALKKIKPTADKTDVQVEAVSLPVRFIASDNDGTVERYHWRLNLTKPVRLARHSFKIEGDSIVGYWGSTNGTLTSPENGTKVDYQLIISKDGDNLDYQMRKKQSHEGLDGYDDAASSGGKQIAQPECDQVRTYILKEPVGLSEKYLPLWKRDFIKDGKVIYTLMYAVRSAGDVAKIYGEDDDDRFVPTTKDIKDNTKDMVEIEKTDVQVEGVSSRQWKEFLKEADGQVYFVDFDKEIITSDVKGVDLNSEESVLKYARDHGYDALIKFDEHPRLIGYDIVPLAVSSEEWDDMSAVYIDELLRLRQLDSAQYHNGQKEYVKYAIRTREGGIGWLKMVSVDDKSMIFEFSKLDQEHVKNKLKVFKEENKPKLSFHILVNKDSVGKYGPMMSEEQIADYKIQLRTNGPAYGSTKKDVYRWLKADHPRCILPSDSIAEEHSGMRYVLVCNSKPRAMLSGPMYPDNWRLTEVEVVKDVMGNPAISFELDEVGQEGMAAVTGHHVGLSMAIVLNGKVIAAPRIQSQLSKRGMIVGRFTDSRIQEIADTLKSSPQYKPLTDTLN